MHAHNISFAFFWIRLHTLTYSLSLSLSLSLSVKITVRDHFRTLPLTTYLESSLLPLTLNDANKYPLKRRKKNILHQHLPVPVLPPGGGGEILATFPAQQTALSGHVSGKHLAAPASFTCFRRVPAGSRGRHNVPLLFTYRVRFFKMCEKPSRPCTAFIPEFPGVF